MPNYEYACGNCPYKFDIVQSIKDDPIVICPVCDKPELKRVFHAVPVFSKGSPTTVGAQAEKNEKLLGRYGLEEKRHQIKTEREAAKKKARAQLGLPEEAPKRPWWRKSDKIDLSLGNLAPDVEVKNGEITKVGPLSKQAEDYIMTGKKP